MANYHRLALPERYQIVALIESGLSTRGIAKALGRSPSTISREVRRNNSVKYSAVMADRHSKQRREGVGPKQKVTGLVVDYVRGALKEGWSPEQIAGRLKLKGTQLSHETIYQYIYNDFKAGGSLHKLLVRKRKRRISRLEARETKSRRNTHKNKNWIDNRPEIVEERNRLGDYERDTILGSHRKAFLLTIVDRTSRLTKIGKLEENSSWKTHEATLQLLEGLPVKTLTNDNGSEFKDSDYTELALGIPVFFNRPYSSWQRGTNENTNGLIRRYIPKGTDISKISHQEISLIETKLNNRPRKILGFRTLLEVHHLLSRSVALGP